MVKDLVFKAPEDMGVPSESILRFMGKAEEHKINLHSFMFVKGGNIIAEAYCRPFFDENFMHRLYSCSKTYAAMAVGRLIGEGKVSLSDKIADYFPEYVNEDTDELLLATTIEDALKMAVPMLANSYSLIKGDNWAESFFRVSSVKPSGMIFNYNTSGSFILGVLVEKLTGMTFLEYLRPVFDAIGVDENIWCVKSPDGYSWGGSGVITTLRNFAKFGELIMHKGNHNGEQLLPYEFMQKATSKQIDNANDNNFTLKRSYGYGYQIWMAKYGFVLSGMGSQFVFCYPDKDFMFVCNADTQSNGTHISEIMLEYCNQCYLEISDKELKKGDAYKELQKRLDEFALPSGYGADFSQTQDNINGVKYILNDNPMNISWFKFLFKDGQGKFQYENERGVKEITFGMESYVSGKFPETHYYSEQVAKPGGYEPKCLASASWPTPDKLLLRVYITDTNMGNCFMNFVFKQDVVGIYMAKTAEFFMNEYQGYAMGSKEA